MTPQKETNKTLIANLKEMEIYELSDKEFRITLLIKFDKPQEHTNRKLNKIRKTIHEQNEKIDRTVETIKEKTKGKSEILEMKMQN